MRAALDGHVRDGLTRAQIRVLMQAMAVREVQTSADARREHLGLWDEAELD